MVLELKIKEQNSIKIKSRIQELEPIHHLPRILIKCNQVMEWVLASDVLFQLRILTLGQAIINQNLNLMGQLGECVGKILKLMMRRYQGQEHISQMKSRRRNQVLVMEWERVQK